MNILTPSRVATNELLDEHDAPLDDVERSLRDLRRFNTWCGGVRAYRILIERLLARHHERDRALRILDLGTGTSDLLESLPGDVLSRIGVDLKIEHLRYGRTLGANRTSPVSGNAKALPFLDDSVDIVTSSHFFHHFSPDENRQILAESLRVSRVGVAVTDTRRHYAPWLFCRTLAMLGLVGEITKFDAPASVLQGYTKSEAEKIACMVVAPRFEIVPILPFRFGLLLWKR